MCNVDFSNSNTNLQAVGLPRLDDALGSRPRDFPDPINERPSYKKRRARQLLHKAACLATAGGDRKAILRMRAEATELLVERKKQLMDFDRAASHPATMYTAAAWGAEPGEPLPEFPRALRRTLLELGVEVEFADKLIDSRGTGGKGKGMGKGKGKVMLVPRRSVP